MRIVLYPRKKKHQDFVKNQSIVLVKIVHPAFINNVFEKY